MYMYKNKFVKFQGWVEQKIQINMKKKKIKK